MNANAFKSEVLVSSSHPVLGRVYWSFVWNGDCNYPDYYGITDSREFAMRLPQGWRDHDYLHWAQRSHVYKVFDADSFGSDYVLEWGEAAPDNEDQPLQYQRLRGTLDLSGAGVLNHRARGAASIRLNRSIPARAN
ncbi:MULTISPECIES: hypothetical protein [Pseudomonas syringae group]|uniref:hypothetical protein n=1 Tax=Pseudomonas syringae group TaxID=136849 RepID=UPI002100374C|nr:MULTISPECIES: hypothetical protein [Pseudomonas syringae group]